MAEGFKIGTAFVEVTADASGVGRDIDRQVTAAGGAVSTAGRGVGTKVMAGIGLGIAGAAALVAGPIMDSINAASDMAESQSKVNTVFGDASTAITSMADNAVASFGLSKSAALDYAGGLGNMYTQLGMTTDAAAKTSEQALTLAADLGSFHNASTPEVLDAYNAALRGEYDSMQKYIPTLNAATVEKKALEMTGKSSAAQLTAEDKAIAAHTYMMENAGAATGDWARTNDSASNQQKQLQAGVENLSSSFGTALLPMFSQLVTFLNDSVMPVLTQLFTFLSENPVVLQIIGAAIGVLTVAFIGLTVATWAMNTALLANPITWIVIGIMALIAAVVLLIMNWDAVVQFVTDVWGGFIGWFTGVMDAFLGWWNGLWTTVWEFIVSVWEGIVSWVTNAWNTLINFIIFALQAYVSIWVSIWNGILSFITGIWNGIVNFVSGAINAVVNTIRNVITGMKATWDAIWNGVSSTVSNIVSNVRGFISNMLSFIGQIPGNIMNALSGAANWLVSVGRDIIGGLINGIRNNVGKIVDTIMGGVNNAINAVKSFLGIKSPSRLFRDEIGKMIPAGVEVGVEAGEASLSKTVAHMVDMARPTREDFAVSARVGQGASSAPAQARQGDIHIDKVVIDASNIEDFNRIIAIFQNLPQTARQGRLSTNGA